MRRSFLLAAILGSILLAACADETSPLKQKMIEMEKRLQKQETDLKEFSAKFSVPRDFSADIQRIEDQQERIAQALKTKVEPVNSKMEEFRDWAQETQKERDAVTKRLKGLEDSLGQLDKKYSDIGTQVNRLHKGMLAHKKVLTTLSKDVADLGKGFEKIRKDLEDNNNRIVEAVKKTLPKIKDAAVADLRNRLTPLEQGLASVKNGLESERKTIAALRSQAPTDAHKAVQSLNQRIKELEEIIASQKGYLLEVGSKIHELELQLRRMSGADDHRRLGYAR